MSKKYVIAKTSNAFSDSMNCSLLNHYFDTLEDAQKFLAELARKEFGEGSFYKTISDDGEADWRNSDYTEGVYFMLEGKLRCIEYTIITLKSYNQKDL